MRASRTFSADTSIPWTAAAWERTVRMNEKSIARVDGPAPCLALFLPNSTKRSRVRFWIFTRPNETFKASKTAAFDRRIGFPTPAMSSLQCDQIGEDARWFVGTSPPDGESAINRTLDVTRPFFRVMTSRKAIGHILSLAPHLNAPTSGLELRKGRYCV